MTKQGLRVTGAPVVPVQGPQSPDAELLIVHDDAPTFVAFYNSSHKPQPLVFEVIQKAKRLGGQVMRRGAVTVLWTRPPTPQLRNSAETCAFG